MASLFGPGASGVSNNPKIKGSPVNSGQAELDASKIGNQDVVNERYNRTQTGAMLSRQLRSNKSGSSPVK